MKPPTQTELFPLLTLSSEASRDRVRTSQLPGKGRDSAGPDRGFGLSAPGLWASFDPVGHCLRMSVLSSSEGLTGCVRTWRATATPSGRFWWVLASGSERPTDGSESGSWPTATQPYGNNRGGGAGRVGPVRPSLEGAVKLWPTATAQDQVASGAACYSTESGRHPGTTLTDAANGLWASPQARDWKGARALGATPGALLPDQVLTPERWGLAGLLDQGSHSGSGSPRGSLNSKWVATLMGYPSDWLDVPTESLSRLWETASSRRSSPASAEPSSSAKE